MSHGLTMHTHAVGLRGFRSKVANLCWNQTLPVHLWTFCPRLTLTPAQICDLPPGTISDIINEHNLTVHWTEKHTHRDCALYTGDPYCASLHELH